MNITILDPANLTPFYCYALGDGLAQHGHRVRFATSKFLHDTELRAPETIRNDEVFFRSAEFFQRWGGKWARRAYQLLVYPWDQRRFLRSVRVDRPDVVHIQWSRVPWLDRRLADRLHALGVPVIHTVHDVTPLFRASGGQALGTVYERCDDIVVHTEANRRDLLEVYPQLREERVHVIPHGPLQADDVPEDASSEDARRQLGLPTDAPVALFFGTIKPYKGLDILVESWERVVERVPEAHLLIAGRPGSPSDVPDLSWLKQRNGVTVNLGFIPNSEVWKYYSACDVVVLPYREITQSGVLLSTFALGRSAIVTEVGGLPEVVRPGETGWIVPKEAPAALADAVVEAMSDRERVLRMGEAAREYVNTELNWARIGQLTADLYEGTLNRRRDLLPSP